MNELQNTKKLIVTSPAAIVDNAAWTTNVIDTLGYDYCVIDIILGATDIAMAVLKLTESDDNSTFTDVTGANFSGSTDIDGNVDALPSATDDNGIFSIEVDLRGRKRYLDLSATGGDGSAGAFMAAIATLGKAKIVPVSATERGCKSILRV